MSIDELKQKCLDDNIPIIRDDMVPFFKKILFEKNISSILEIGTAYGYSSWVMKNIKPDLLITSIEKNPDNYQIAKSYLPNDINLVNDDAFTFLPSRNYDLIFLDGPKNKQSILFDKYINYLSDDGIMVIDNVYLKDVKNKTPNKSRMNLIKHNEEFIEQLLNSNEFNKELINIADGVIVVWNKK